MERKRLIAAMAPLMSVNEEEELEGMIFAFAKGARSEKQFYDYLLGKAEELSLPLEDYSELKHFGNYVSVFDGLDLSVSDEEIRTLEGAIIKHLCENGEQRGLMDLEDRLYLMKNIRQM